MALTTVELATLGIMDRFAYQVQAAGYVLTGGTDVWARTDATEDETFENYVNNAQATALDTALLTPNFGKMDQMQAWIKNLADYMTAQSTSLQGFFADLMLRVDESAAAILSAAGFTLSVANVHARADGGATAPGRLLGQLIRGGSITSAAEIDTDVASASPILGRVTVIGSADWTVTATLTIDSETDKSIEQVITGTGSGGAVGDTYVFGAEAASSGAAADQDEIALAATAQFHAGQTVLITEWTGSPPSEAWAQQEYAVVESVTDNTKIVLTTDLLHTYSGAAYVYPCFIGASAASGTGGSTSDALQLYPAPDRRLKL
jgi:hypothetical protein